MKTAGMWWLLFATAISLAHIVFKYQDDNMDLGLQAYIEVIRESGLIDA